MTDRGTQLLHTGNAQIGELVKLIAAGEESILGRPCPGRQKPGDGSIGAVALLTAGNYHRIACFVCGNANGAHDHAGPHNHPPRTEDITLHQLLHELSTAQSALSPLADLTDEQLDAVPPAGSARFCDGQRTLEQVITATFNHQRHQVDAVRAAVT